MDLQRLLELCDVLQECKLLPYGHSRVYAEVNAQREIRRIIAAAVPGWCTITR